MSKAPQVGMVSLGCPKALVDSERILTRLKAQGYGAADAYGRSDVVVVNTCGFIDSARAESLEAIAEACASGRPVVVTGCLGGEADALRARFPGLAAVTAAQDYAGVVDAVARLAPAPKPGAVFEDPAGLKLTPPHYAYLKISEGCDHACAFCIIPSLRGGLRSRPLDDILLEAEALAAGGCKELLVVAQDTSAYGLDLRYAPRAWRGRERPSDLFHLAEALGELGAWVRLHYVYPYPHVDRLLPLMAEGRVLPYLDIPFQHASPRILKAMRRPANEARTLERLASWRAACPDIVVRSTFVVGFPGETEEDFQRLLDWLEAAELDRVGCFAYENVEGASARELPDHVPETVKGERRRRLMAHAARISRRKLERRIGRTLEVVVDRVEGETALARSYGEAPEVDGVVRVAPAFALRPGARVKVRIEGADHHDLFATPLDLRLRRPPAAGGRLHRVIGRR